MACTTINAKILLRRDTSANWTSINPILALGEPAFETDTNRLKIGDGVTAWNDLPYIGVADNNLIFETPIGEPNARQLTEYKENDSTYTVREVITAGNILKLILASFTPTLSAVGLLASTLNWDDACIGFSVSVTNPSDFLTQYISGVASAVAQGGSNFSPLGAFTTTGPSQPPAGGVSWSQTFSTNGTGVIRSSSTTIAGGSSSAIISFFVTPNGSTIFETTVTLTINWNTPSLAISTAPLLGNTFLRVYDSTTYSLNVTGISNPANYVHNVTGVGGTVSNNTGNGTFTFTDPVHKNTDTSSLSVSTSTTFTRPIAVTGTSYPVTISPVPASVNAFFGYPSIWLLKPPLTSPPTSPDRTEIVSATLNGTPTGFNTPSVNVLGGLYFSDFVQNLDPVNNVVFWFGIAASYSQPTIFKAGGNNVNASDFTPFISSVSLYPTTITPLAGYTPVNYNLYGVTVQNNSTLYVIMN